MIDFVILVDAAEQPIPGWKCTSYDYAPGSNVVLDFTGGGNGYVHGAVINGAFLSFINPITARPGDELHASLPPSCFTEEQRCLLRLTS